MSEVDESRALSRDVLGARLKLGVLIPSTNTVVEPEYHALAPDGVSVHSGRLLITEPGIGDDEAFHRLIDQVRDSLSDTLRSLLTCEPDWLALGMTALSFLGGSAGDRRLSEQISEQSGLPVMSGPAATAQALTTLGSSRIGLLTPYQPFAEAEAVRYFTEEGFDVVRVRSLRSPSATSIAKVTPEQLMAIIEDTDGPDIDAIVQVGTNLAMAHVVEKAEAVVDKPVLAINAATVWAVLRAQGIDDRLDGYGTLLAEH